MAVNSSVAEAVSGSPRSSTHRLSLLFLAILLVAGHRTLAAAEVVLGDGGALRVVDNTFSTQSYARIAMQKNQLDRKYGFQLQVTPAGSAAASMTALQSDSADISIFNWLDVARMRNSGVDVIGVAPFLELGADYFIVPANSTIKNVGDFRGKRIGVNARTSINWMITIATARKVYNLDLQREATVQEASPNLLRALLEQGQIDGSHVFNNLTPDLLVGGKFKVMSQVKDMVAQLGLPSGPFLIWGVNGKYAAGHPGNVKAFVAAYREAVAILKGSDAAWVDHARELQMTDPAIALLREEMRVDTLASFTPDSEANIRKTFDALRAILGPDVLGIDKMPASFMTLDYQ